MVHEPVECRPCGSREVIRYGVAPNGKQKYVCHSCGRQSREKPGSNADDEEHRNEILRAYEERSSVRGLERTFGVSRNMVTTWLRKKGLNFQH